MLRFGDFTLDSGARLLKRGDAAVPLTAKAFQLLELLASKRPKVVPKAAIHKALWPDTFVTEASLHTVVAELRHALDDDPKTPRFLRTVHGYGYAFCAEAVEELTQPFPIATARQGTLFAIVWGERELPLAAGENVIGRDPDLPLCIAATTVSRRHACITITAAGATIEDLGSKNGTFIGGHPLTNSQRLRDGDEIRFGSIEVVFRAVGPATPTQTIWDS
jgi:DNA-binding winged helix-turn-helix (wHTH) protein